MRFLSRFGDKSLNENTKISGGDIYRFGDDHNYGDLMQRDGDDRFSDPASATE